MYKGYDSSKDLMYSPYAVLLCAAEAGSLVLMMKGKF